MAHNQNRKFITSTGVLLKTLADEPRNSGLNQPPPPPPPASLSFTNKSKYAGTSLFQSSIIAQIHPSDIAVIPSSIGQQQTQRKPPNYAQQTTNKNPAYKTKPSNTASAAVNDDIEIVEVATSQQSTSLQDSNLRSSLAKNYGHSGANSNENDNSISITAKPQSNFVNNVTCLKRLLIKNDLYESKLRRCKPYSNLRSSAIISTVNRYLDASDDDGGSDGGGGDAPSNKKVIIIDDSNEEMHKPWISPDLIKLIKQRNLLQAKLNESKADDQAVNEELMKKFKNLRNKVTKLVKKARKDYLAKYGQESGAVASQVSKQLDSNISLHQTDSSLSTETRSQPTTSTAASSTTTLTITTSATTTATATATTTTTTTPAQSSDPIVNELLNKIASGSFLKEQSALMASMYSTYYTQYVEQYTKAQQEAAAEASAAGGSYDGLQKQAAQYAKQQRSVQNQLEATLIQSAQQLIQEIANAAADKAKVIQQQQQPALQPQQPPFVINPLNPFNLPVHPVHHY